MGFSDWIHHAITKKISDDSKLELGHSSPSMPVATPRSLKLTKSMTFGESSSQNDEERLEEDVDSVHFNLADLHIDVPRIVESLNSHVRFRVKEGYELRNLPKFDDSTRYNITDIQELNLWRLEVERLTNAAKSEEPPVLEGDQEWFGPADSDGYNRLHLLARQIRYALDICIHDNQLLLLENQPQLASVDRYERAHRRICHIFDQNRGSIRYDRSIKLKDNNDQAYHALVNYVTAVLIRMLLRSMSGKLWVENCVSTLAKFATKLKVLSTDLTQAFERTLEAHSDFQVRVSQAPDVRGAISQAQQNASGSEDSPLANQQKALLQEEVDTSGFLYFMLKSSFSEGMNSLIRGMVVDLSWDEETEQTADVFETSATVYDTGFPGRRTLLCQERDGSIGAAADRRVMNFAGLAFEIGLEIWERLPSLKLDQPGHHTTIAWSRKRFHNKDSPRKQDTRKQGYPSPDEHRQLTKMSDVIAMMVPYMMYCGQFSSTLGSFTQLVVLLSDAPNLTRYYRQKSFVSVVRIYTSESEHNSDIAPVAQTVFQTEMTQNALRGFPNQEVTNQLEEVKNWIIDEKSIIIQHSWYAWVSLAACGFLIAGGMAMIAIQDKVHGVDPTNLTALAWAAAGFIMVYFKSRRVHDWPWRDFLSGRIVCRSVSDVISVTGMDPQVLMAILLRQDPQNFLKTRGPFNTLFSRKADDGFSIDVPALTSTVINGGIIFVRVDSLTGPAVVGLSAKNRQYYDSISPKDRVKNGENVICRDFLDPGQYLIGDGGTEKVDGENRLPLYTICTNELEWHRVRGVFSKRALFD